MFRKNGFSLIDLVISMAIVMLMVVLILPVIQHNRESARSRFCTVRLRLIGEGVMHYESVNERLPCFLGSAGAIDILGDMFNSSSNNYYENVQQASPLALIEWSRGELTIDPIFVDFDVPVLVSQNGLKLQFYNLSGWRDAYAETRPEFRCPSDVLDPVVAANMELANQPGFTTDRLTEDQLGTVRDSTNPGGYTNFVGCLGASTGGFQRSWGCETANVNRDTLWQFRGMITSRENMQSCFVSDGDGLSNTIMFGETIGSVETIDGVTEVASRFSWLSGGAARGRGTASWMQNGTPEFPMLGSINKSSFIGFGSAHRFGVGFVFGDGSVRRLSQRVDWQTFYQMCGAFDSLD